MTTLVYPPIDEDYQPLMIDIGHDMTKCGFSGDDFPRATFPTLVGRPKEKTPLVGMDQKDCFVGDEAEAKRKILHNNIPIPSCREGKFDMEDFGKILHHSYYNELVITPEEHPIMLTSPSAMDHKLFMVICEKQFEEHMTLAFNMCDPLVLSLYANGSVTGQALDCGSCQISTMSIFEGLPLPHTKIFLENTMLKERRKRIGGDLMTDLFFRNLEKRYSHEDVIKEEDMKLLKESCSSFSIREEDIERHKSIPGLTKDKEPFEPSFRNPYSANVSMGSYWDNQYRKEYDRKMRIYRNKKRRNSKRGSVIEYELPDGSFVLDIYDERFDIPEILFRPSVLPGYHNLPGIHELIEMSISRSDLDLHEEMWKNITVSGGVSTIGNFQSRLHLELEKLLPQKKFQLRVRANKDRKFGVWMGGSVLTSLDSFRKEWMTLREYNDKGGWRVVKERCQYLTFLEDFRDGGGALDSTSFWEAEKKDQEERRLFVLEELSESTEECSFIVSLSHKKLIVKYKSLLL